MALFARAGDQTHAARLRGDVGPLPWRRLPAEALKSRFSPRQTARAVPRGVRVLPPSRDVLLFAPTSRTPTCTQCRDILIAQAIGVCRLQSSLPAIPGGEGKGGNKREGSAEGRRGEGRGRSVRKSNKGAKNQNLFQGPINFFRYRDPSAFPSPGST